MNEENRRNWILGGIAVVAIGVAGFLYFRGGDEPAIPEVKGGIYYTGPMKSKNPANSDVYGTVDGKQMTATEAKAQVDKWQQDNLQKK